MSRKIGEFPNTTGRDIGRVTSWSERRDRMRRARTDFDLIKKIEQAVQMAKMDDDWRHTYMMYQIQERDAELRGEKRGEQRGIAIGEQRGKQLGEQDARLSIAREMLIDHEDEQRVARMCRLPLGRVLEIKAQLAIQ